LNIEAEGRHASDMPDRMLHYAVLLRHHHGLPVRSVVILLRASANASAVTGTLEVRRRPDEPPYLTFAYEVVRLWAKPLAPLLTGPVGLLPLAPLTDEAQADLPGVVGRVVERLRTETTREQAGKALVQDKLVNLVIWYYRVIPFTVKNLSFHAHLGQVCI
jgi:hypothetical protein